MLVGVTPALKELKQGIKHMDEREHIVYKIVLDLLGAYLSANEAPLFTKYRNKYLPLSLAFYKKLSNEDVRALNATVKVIINDNEELKRIGML